MFGAWLFDYERMAIFRVHAEMIGGGQNAGIAGNTFLVDIKTTGNVLFEFLILVGHGANLEQSGAPVILSFISKDGTAVRL